MEPKRLPDEQITALIEWAKRRMEFENFQVDNGIQRHADAIHAQRVYVALSSIPALLAHADALAADKARWEECAFTVYDALLLVANRATTLAAENARLRAAVVALVDAEAHGIPGGYIGVDPSGETHDRHCTYCYTSWQLGEPERHAPDCPIAAARRALEGGE